MRKKNKIKITVNGKQTVINSNFSLKNLVDKLEIPLNKIAIEYNKEIIDKKKIKNLKNLDQIFDPHVVNDLRRSAQGGKLATSSTCK